MWLACSEGGAGQERVGNRDAAMQAARGAVVMSARGGSRQAHTGIGSDTEADWHHYDDDMRIG